MIPSPVLACIYSQAQYFYRVCYIFWQSVGEFCSPLCSFSRNLRIHVVKSTQLISVQFFLPLYHCLHLLVTSTPTPHGLLLLLSSSSSFIPLCQNRSFIHDHITYKDFLKFLKLHNLHHRRRHLDALFLISVH